MDTVILERWEAVRWWRVGIAGRWRQLVDRLWRTTGKRRIGNANVNGGEVGASDHPSNEDLFAFRLLCSSVLFLFIHFFVCLQRFPGSLETPVLLLLWLSVPPRVNSRS